jgi:hypothetical protein
VFFNCSQQKPIIEEEVEILPADRLVKKLETNRRKIKSFEGFGIISIKSPEFNNSADFKIVLQKPDSVYLVVFGPFKMELANILVTRKDFIFYDALSNTAYKGEVNSNILKAIFKINISFTDLIDAFIGSVNLTDKLYRNPDNYKVEYDKYIITYKDSLSESSTTFSVNVRDLGISDYFINDDRGKILLNGEYSDFSVIENVSIPYKINLTNPTQNQYIQIEYNKIVANSKNIYIDFVMPSDVTIIKW